ncbi:leucine-rich repeat domain-containing protein [Chryseobacterium contaminans]|nr:hypothetical protein [Chryseobacterium contaminans]
MKKTFKNHTLILLGVCFLFCANISLNAQDKLENITKNLKSGNVYEELDLSNLNLEVIPDLSKYTIKKLDLSHNNITKFKSDLLPLALEKLNISHNKIDSALTIQKIENCKKFNLKELNVSFNKIQSISISCNLHTLEVNNNDIKYLDISDKYLNYLDVSNNPRFSNIVQFNPNVVKTLKRENIASDSPLEYVLSKRKNTDLFDLKHIKKIDNSTK